MAEAKPRKQGTIQETIADRQPEMAAVKRRGPYIRDQKMKIFFKNLVRQRRSAAGIRQELRKKFPDAPKLPSDRTMARWAAEAKKEQGDAPWEWTDKEGDEWVLQVQTAVLEHTNGETLISEKEAEYSKFVHRLVPRMPPLTAWFFAQELLSTPEGHHQHIMSSLSFARAISAKDDRWAQTLRAHVASHVQHWADRTLVAWVINGAVSDAYIEEVEAYRNSADLPTYYVDGGPWLLNAAFTEEADLTWWDVHKGSEIRERREQFEAAMRDRAEGDTK